MNTAFNSCPVLNETLFTAIGYIGELPEFSYSEDYEEFPLRIEKDEGLSSIGKVIDPRCNWSPETHDLLITKKCSLAQAYCLFGIGGIVPSTAEVGVALKWISTKSDVCGIIPFGVINKLDSAIEFTASAVLAKGLIKGSLKLQTFLYLKDPGKQFSNETYLARQPGTVLGILDQYEIFIDGNGSLFPIMEVNKPGEPLWKVFFNDSCDPLHDKFDNDNVEIQLNKAHPSYENLRVETSISETPLLLEVLSSALFVIFVAAKEAIDQDWDKVMNGEAGEDYDTGSIADAVHHFVTKLGWNIDTPTKLAASIKEYFENIKQGE